MRDFSDFLKYRNGRMLSSLLENGQERYCWKSRSNLTLCGERKLTPRQNKIDPINVLAAGGNFILSIL